MIIDTIDNLGKYVVLNPLFADVVEFLKDHDLQTLEPGKYPIKDKDAFLNLQVAKQRTKDTAFLETHIEMIDIQIPISCAETVNPGQFAIFFPRDGHAPCITDTPEIKKAIFKIKA